MPIYFDDDQLSMRLIWGSNTDPLYVFRNGGISDSDSYIRLNTAYASDPLGTVIEVPRDVPPYEHVDGEKRFLQSEGTNKVLVDGTPNGSTIGINGATVSIVGNRYRIVNDTESTIYPYLAGTHGNLNVHSFSIIASGSIGTFVSAQGSTNIPLDIIFERRKSTYTSISSTGSIHFIIQPGMWIEFNLPQLTETTYQLPTIVSSKDGPVTVNKGTTSLLAEDIADACYNFDNSSADCITTTINPSIHITGDFSIDVSIKRKTYNSQARIYEADGGGSNRFYLREGATDGEIVLGLYSWTATVPAIIDSDAAKYTIELIGTHGKLLKNNVVIAEELSIIIDIPNSPIIIGADSSCLNNFDGYIWDFPIKDGSGNFIEHYKLSQYREDTFVKGEYGNHGTASRNVNLILAENQGFGYPVNETARKPWSYTTDDGVVVPFGLREFFGGKADGSLENSGSLAAINRYKVITTETDHFGAGVVAGDIVTGLTTALDANNTVRQVSPAVGTIPFTSYIPHGFPEDVVINGDFATDTDWTKGTGWTISGGTANCDGTQVANSLLYQSAFSTPNDDNDYFILKGDFVTTAGELRYFNGSTADDILDGSCTLLFQKKEDYEFATLVANTDFIGSADNVDIRKLIVILKNSFGEPILYIDPFDHLIKAADGTNTCVSASPVILGSENTGWLSFNGDKSEMWITLAGTKGTISVFAGYFPEVGNRLFTLSNGIYQTIDALSFNVELPFEYIYHNDEITTLNGENLKYYL